MDNYFRLIVGILSTVVVVGCKGHVEKGTYGYDKQFLESHQHVIHLYENKGKSQLMVLPYYQGRVMTSTAKGEQGNSYGWVNYDLISSGDFEKHINVFGGEDRFWIGPEGGQYSIFFKKDTDFTFENWFTPKEIDTEAFDVVNQSDKSVLFHKKMKLVNYKGFAFDIDVNREVTIFNNQEIKTDLEIDLSDDVDCVGYQSFNEIINTGEEAWSKDTGLLSVWILGMFMPSDNTTVILPYKNELVLNTSYFGEVPPGRLTKTDKHVTYKGNGTARFKLGLSPRNIIPYVGSYDADTKMLTIVNYTFKGDSTYVNSIWKLQDEPYKGDVVNSYNDGPLDNGDQLGPFYELESSSSAKELTPGASIKHIHKTYHFEGKFEELNKIAIKLLGKDLKSL
ncbi:hypothetical protein FHR24_002300 [Wenyingzhuangia heitensis]|uniref:Methane oxygenase PmoA n=1 Tax=Wenyingzhuangia heitensis TaxID=1487859 RepID=A0ABX0UAH9_9FLAO|nr:DUF6786 family protein [Wenyingzhuangia heitensis]NIJ45829.1 hypothetical protein [Wenyingzhuangia heitensis]